MVYGAAKTFEVTLEDFVGNVSSVEIEVKVYASATDQLWGDFDNPITPAPVNERSYEGSYHFVFTDAGLTSGRTYYYAVRAVSPTGKLSAPSFVGRAAPGSGVVPWHNRENSQAIIAAIRGLDPELATGRLRVASPDGTIYDSEVGVLPPAGRASPDMNAIDYDMYTYWVLPPTGTAQNSNSGPFRRVVAAPGSRGKPRSELTFRTIRG